MNRVDHLWPVLGQNMEQVRPPDEDLGHGDACRIAPLVTSPGEGIDLLRRGRMLSRCWVTYLVADTDKY